MLTLIALACAGPAGDSGQPAAPFSPEIPTSTCAASPYDWAPLDRAGELVEFEKDDSLSLTADTIRLLLDTQGLGAFADLVEHDVETWRVRYLTQDRGEAVEATGFFVLPASAESFPTLLWLHPTMGFSDACAPTALGLEGAAFPMLFASMGMAAVAPDYLGMNGWGEPSGRLHPYVVPEPTAVASLDAVRALERFASEEGTAAVPDTQRLVLWGASEGGFAALWTDRYQPHYAPEFESVAVVATVAPTDLPGLAVHAVSELTDTSFGLAGVVVAEQEWYGQGDLADVLQADVAAALPGEMAQSCDDFPAVEDVVSVEDLFTPEFVAAGLAADFSPLPPFDCFLGEGQLRSSVIPYDSTAPVLLVLAEDDQLVWSEPSRDDIDDLCADGYLVEHFECAGASHVDGAVDSLPQQLEWIQARLRGDALGETCVVHEPVECDPLVR